MQAGNLPEGSYEQALTYILSQPAPASTDIKSPVILYGAGELGLMAYEYCELVGIEVACVVDKNARKIKSEKLWQGISIVAPEDVSDKSKTSLDTLICVATIPFAELNASLKALGWSKLHHFYQLCEQCKAVHPLGNGWVANEVSQQDRENMLRLMQSWDDDVSVQHYLQFLAWRCCHQELCYDKSSISLNDRFFIDIIKDNLPANIRFADIGAHKGKVTRKLHQIAGGFIEKVWLFEPDPVNFACLEADKPFFQEMSRSEPQLFNFALSKNGGAKPFYSGLDYASQISPLSCETVPCESLDSQQINPNLIKIHAEGEELNIFKGAKETLLKNRPLFSATIYHNRDGLWETGCWLRDNLPDYSLFFRLHSWVGTGAVIYGVPDL